MFVNETHDAPEFGAVKSTRTLGAGSPFAFRTVALMNEPVALALIVASGSASTAP